MKISSFCSLLCHLVYTIKVKVSQLNNPHGLIIYRDFKQGYKYCKYNLLYITYYVNIIHTYALCVYAHAIWPCRLTVSAIGLCYVIFGFFTAHVTICIQATMIVNEYLSHNISWPLKLIIVNVFSRELSRNLSLEIPIIDFRKYIESYLTLE